MLNDFLDKSQALIFMVRAPDAMNEENKDLFTNIMQLLNDQKIPVLFLVSQNDKVKPDLEALR